MHLEDCRQSSSDGLVHALEVIETLRAWLNSQQQHDKLWDGGETFESRLVELRTDLDYLISEVNALQPSIKDLQKTIREHLDLTHTRRNTIITIVAAIYVPLSFATSLFGMNINTTTSPGPKGFSNYTADWIHNSPVESRNSTRALVSSIGSSGASTFSWQVFGITAACLVVTLPLSLAIGTIVRQIYRNTLHYALYWRAVAVIPGAIFLFFSIFGLLITRDYTIVHKGFDGFFAFLTYQSFAAYYYTFIGPYWACNGALVLFELVMAVLNYSNGRRFAFWFSVLLISGGCLGADMALYRQSRTLYAHERHLSLYFPMMLVPWSIFAYMWIKPWWKSRQKWWKKTVTPKDASTVANS